MIEQNHRALRNQENNSIELFSSSSSSNSSSSARGEDPRKPSSASTSQSSTASERANANAEKATKVARATAREVQRKAKEIMQEFTKKTEETRAYVSSNEDIKLGLEKAKEIAKEFEKRAEIAFKGTTSSSASSSSASGGTRNATSIGEERDEKSTTATNKAVSGFNRWFQVARDAVREEIRLLQMDEGAQIKEKRKKQMEQEKMYEPYDGTTAVQITKQRDPSRFERMFEDIKEKLGFSEENMEKIGNSEAIKKLKNVQEDLRERWETSDSPMVHRIQDASESFFGETDQAEAMKLIRQMDTGFNTSDFLAEVRSSVPDVIKSYLMGDVEALSKMENISPEIIERMGGQINAWKSQGHVVDARLLHVSELELVEIRVLDNYPTVVIQFACQQVNCVRDKNGAIIEGANDDIQSVHYLWAMQLSDVEFETSDGRKFVKPTWQLREMVLRGMMAIV